MTSSIDPSEQEQPSRFTYEQLDEQTREFVQQKANEIHGLLKRTAAHVLQIGQDLLEVRGKLPRGSFLPWLKDEFEMSQRTAYNFINVAERFQGKFAIIANLPTTILYELASPELSEEIVE